MLNISEPLPSVTEAEDAFAAGLDVFASTLASNEPFNSGTKNITTKEIKIKLWNFNILFRSKRNDWIMNFTKQYQIFAIQFVIFVKKLKHDIKNKKKIKAFPRKRKQSEYQRECILYQSEYLSQSQQKKL